MVLTFPTSASVDGCGRVDASMAVSEEITSFLAQYKPIECDCCNLVIGFINRVTGNVKCSSSGQLHQGISRSKLMTSSQSLIVSSSGGGEHAKVTENTAVRVRPAVKVNGPVATGTSTDVVDGCGPKLPSKVKVSLLGPGPTKPAPTAGALRAPLDSASVKTSRSAGSLKGPAESAQEENPFFKSAPPLSTLPPALNPSPMQMKPSVSSAHSTTTTAKPSPVKKASTSENDSRTKTAVQTLKTSGRPVGVNPFKATKPKYSWMNMKYSPNIQIGKEVKATFIYAVNKYQIQAIADEDAAFGVQEVISSYISSNASKTFAKLNRKPAVDEVVLGCYNGEDHYRARVLEVRENDCTVLFIDFGDVGSNKYDVVYEITEELMQPPIYSLTLGLLGVPRVIPKIQLTQQINDKLYDKVTLKWLGTLEPSEVLQVDGILCDNNTDQTINEQVLELLNTK